MVPLNYWGVHSAWKSPTTLTFVSLTFGHLASALQSNSTCVSLLILAGTCHFWAKSCTDAKNNCTVQNSAIMTRVLQMTIHQHKLHGAQILGLLIPPLVHLVHWPSSGKLQRDLWLNRHSTSYPLNAWSKFKSFAERFDKFLCLKRVLTQRLHLAHALRNYSYAACGGGTRCLRHQ